MGKKDRVSSAFDDFWASDYKAPTRAKRIYDDSFDAFWGKGEYATKVNASRGSVFVQDVKPVQYSNAGLTRKQDYNLKVKNLQLQKLQAERNAIASQKMSNFVGGVVRSGSSVIKRGVRITIPAVTSRIKETKFYQNRENQAIINEEWAKYKVAKREEEKASIRKSIRAKYYPEVPKDKIKIDSTNRPLYG